MKEVLSFPLFLLILTIPMAMAYEDVWQDEWQDEWEDCWTCSTKTERVTKDDSKIKTQEKTTKDKKEKKPKKPKHKGKK